MKTRPWLITAMLSFNAGCAGVHSTHPVIPGPRLRVLGTVQDGGLPHAACTCANCNAARHDPARKRFISSLALLLPASDSRPRIYLIDAGPDIRAQLDLLADVRRAPSGQVDRSPVDGVFLTHAHIGHYLGLAFFGFEAVNSHDLAVYCTHRMAGFLQANGPWSQLVRLGNIRIQEHEPGEPIALGDTDGSRITVIPVHVPHRDEYSDTVGYIFRSAAVPSAPSILFVSDTEPWRTWSPGLLDLIAREHVVIALLDGTFFSPDELPGRPVSSIGHPLMRDTMDLLEPLVRSGQLAVCFTHLNHSNPALDPASSAAREIDRRGFHIAAEGQELAIPSLSPTIAKP